LIGWLLSRRVENVLEAERLEEVAFATVELTLELNPEDRGRHKYQQAGLW